ncbi:phosphodiesterase [Mycobacterium sp. ACS4331]|uniref:phosphodiesterase n=1 Tax=Mycobacterium sp. ACS4331 TaxID=1834121 RepID=UPI0007FBD2D5|nr:phosphodiesterase [Mycobacterium sp. ACS4331]OBF12003.1 phosphodiesterase [Mycobacterium sp. ACS4331]
MKASEVAALPFRAGAAMRHARLFHPDGVLCGGTLRRTAASDSGLPLADSDVVGRISKGVGTSGGLPDFAGLAWRSHAQGSTRPWDVLMVSASARLLLHPTRSWSAPTFSTLMPYGYRGGVFWLRARMTSPEELHGLDVGALRRHIAAESVVFDIEQAQGRNNFEPLATLEFGRELDSSWPPEDVSFDPTLNTTPGVTLLPDWLAAVRRRAYRSSRQGRDSE